MSHYAIREALLERHAKSLEARACLLDVGHGDGDMAEPLRLGIARMVWRRFQRLRAVIVGKFEDAWRAADRTRREICDGGGGKLRTFAIEKVGLFLGIRGLTAGAVKGEEVEREVTENEFCSITEIRSVTRIDREKSMISAHSQ